MSGNFKGPILTLAVVLILSFLGLGIPGAVNEKKSELPSSYGKGLTSLSGEGGVFLWGEEDPVLWVLTLEGGDLVEETLLDSLVSDGVPTPGGVSVFLLSESSEVEVYSSLDGAFQTRIQPDVESVESLSFSPDGSRVFLEDEKSEVSVFQHRKRILTSPKALGLVGGSGNLIFNRRGSRSYRGGESLNQFYGNSLRKTWSREINVHNLVFSKDYQTLWGLGEDGKILLLSPGNGEVESQIEGDFRQLISTGEAFVALSETGNTISWFKEQNPKRVQQLELPITADFLVHPGKNRLWAFSKAGKVVEISNGNLGQEWQIPLNGKILGGGVGALVQSNGSFACF